MSAMESRFCISAVLQFMLITNSLFDLLDYFTLNIKMNQRIQSLTSFTKTGEVSSISFSIEKQRNLTPDPISFLDNLVARPHKNITIAEEIFDEENQRFYERYYQKVVTPKTPPSKKEKRDIATSSHACIKSNPKSLSPIYKNKRFQTNFPVTPTFNRKLIISSQNFQRKAKHIAVDHIIEACESAGKKDMSSYNLEKSIGKDRKIAARYVKDIEWTSNKINELTAYHSDIIKILYEESKVSNKLTREEKASAYQSFNNVSLKEYKEKVKTIKGVLSKLRDRIFY